uniref:Uncharacterized protein n=1 Tax=Glossina palpalis gambiensis TaxID=67801 RepID=A0A1B0BGE1_9MUSC
MSCTVSELPSGCRLRGMSSASQNTGTDGGGNGTNSGGIHIGSMLNPTGGMTTTTGLQAVAGNTGGGLPDVSTPLQQRQQSQKPCCFCWCCCCSCSW